MNGQPQAAVSGRTLFIATLFALVLAFFIILLFVLPAEFNKDLTGIGAKLGLTELAPHDDHDDAHSNNEAAIPGSGIGFGANTEFESFDIEVPANAGVEYKFSMNQYAKMAYEWSSDGAALYFDLHGEPKGDTADYYESYSNATVTDMKGSFTAPYAGSHGWYWRNETPNAVAVRLKVKGQYVVTGYK